MPSDPETTGNPHGPETTIRAASEEFDALTRKEMEHWRDQVESTLSYAALDDTIHRKEILKDFYEGFYPEKIEAFAETQNFMEIESEDIFDLLRVDPRKRVQELLHANHTYFQALLSKGLHHSHLTPEQIRKRGAHMVAELVRGVEERWEKTEEKKLTNKEIKALRDAAKFIPDAEVLEEIMEFVADYPQLGNALLENPFFNVPVEGEKEKERLEQARKWASQILSLVGASLKSSPDEFSAHPWHQLLLRVFHFIEKNSAFSEFKDRVIAIVQSSPRITREFVNNPSIDKDTLRDLLPISFIRKTVNNEAWHKVYKDLRLKRYDLLDEPMKDAIRQNPALRKYYDNPMANLRF